MKFNSLKAKLAVLATVALLSAGAQAQVTVPSGGSLVVPPGGALGLGCTALNVLGDFQLNSGQVNGAGGVSINTGGSLNGGAGTINLSGNWSNTGTFVAGTGSVVIGDGCGSGPSTLSGNTVFNNLTLSGSGRQFVIPSGSQITVNGTLTLQGAPGAPIQLVASDLSTAFVRLGPNAQVVQSNVLPLNNVVIGTPPVANIPTLSEWGLIGLVMAMSLMVYLRRRRWL